MKKEPFILKTWVICILFALWFLYGIPLIIGIILLIIKTKWEKAQAAAYQQLKFDKEQLDNRITPEMWEPEKLQKLISERNKDLEKINSEISKNNDIIAQLSEKIANLRAESEKADKQLHAQARKLEKSRELYKSIDYCINTFINSETNYVAPVDTVLLDELAPSVILKLHCMDVKDLQKAYRSNDKQIDTILTAYSARYTTKANQAIYQLMVIALRSELQNILYGLKYEKLDTAINEVKTVTAKYLSIAGTGNQSISGTLTKFIGEIEYLFINAVKIEYNYYVKKEQARQEQLAIKEQMRQEAEERKALENEKRKIEKEEAKYHTEIDRVTEQMKTASDDEIEKLKAQILSLQQHLSDVIVKKDEIVNLQNGKAGNVYIISNLGSFGDDVFKIGMTRRSDPQERVNELGSASVPFQFDVHSFIFSEDAVALETKLHQTLNDKRVNKVNLRKEFFRCSLDELEKLVTEIDPSAEFNRTMAATEFRQSLSSDEAYTNDYTIDDEDDSLE